MVQNINAELVPSIRIEPVGDGRGYRSSLSDFSADFEAIAPFPGWGKAGGCG
jgi:hypothetical protein